MKSVPPCLVLLLCVAGAGPATAQQFDVPSKLSLADALRIAEERNPALASGRALVKMAEADQVTAKAHPNPAFSFQSEGYPLFSTPWPGFFDSQEMYLRVDQEIETAGRLRLRTAVAEAGRHSAAASLEDERRRLRLEVRRTYFQLVLAKADEETARASLAEIDKVIAVNRARLEQGEISGGEMRRVQVERLRFMDDVFAADLAARNARSSLLALMNAPRLDLAFDATEELRGGDGQAGAVPAVGTPAAAVNDRHPDAADAGQIAREALAGRADLAAVRSDEAQAESETRLQQALRTPNITIGGGFRRDFGQNGVLATLTVPLPLFDRHAGPIARADAERQLAASRVATTEAAVALDVQQALNAVEVSRARVAYIEQEYLENAREARDIVLTSYTAGAVDVLDFLDAQRSYRETERTYNRALFDYRISIFQLDAAVGR